MEQFSLEKWLQDKSRKVVTRRGNPVRIICTDRKHGEDDLPIVFLEENNGGEFLLTCRNDGRCDNYDTQYDLFFADEEEELTEFEKELQTIISEASHWTSDDGSMSTYCQFGDKEIKKISAQILDLARNELEKEIKDEEYFRLITEHYKQGKQDALKDLPKWKRLSKLVCFDRTNSGYFAFIGNDTSKPAICCNGYYISLADLEKLSKE